MTKNNKQLNKVAIEMHRALASTKRPRRLEAFKTSLTRARLTHRREHLWLGRAMEGAPI